MAEKADDHGVDHYEREGSDVDVKDSQGWSDARAANEDEHSLTIRDALKQYRWAVMWSLIVSMCKYIEGGTGWDFLLGLPGPPKALRIPQHRILLPQAAGFVLTGKKRSLWKATIRI